MTRFRTLYRAAAVWPAALGLMLLAPLAAGAQDCTSQYIQCIAEHGGSTQCPHEYIACVSRTILEY
jgi:hypothetical protein